MERLKKFLALVLDKLKSSSSCERDYFQNLARECLAVLVIICVLYFSVYIIQEVKSEYLIIEPLEVTDNLSKSGYTGKTIAQKLSTRLENIKLNSSVSFNSIVINSGASNASDIIIPGSGNSLRSLIVHFKERFNGPLFIASGHVVEDNKQLKMLISMRGDSSVLLTNSEEYITNKDNFIDEIINTAALKLYVQVNPIATAGFYFNKKDYDTAIKILNATTIKPVYNDVAHLLWAASLYRQNKFDLALDKIKLAQESKNDTFKEDM